jgi:hypothetical protein
LRRGDGTALTQEIGIGAMYGASPIAVLQVPVNGVLH